MKQTPDLWTSPERYLRARAPQTPIAFFCPGVLADTAQAFQSGFPGCVTYAVKANADRQILANLHAHGLSAFDVASPAEIDLVRTEAPTAALHYNNPVRSVAEIRHGAKAGVASWSVDRLSELEKLCRHLPDRRAEVSVRLKLPVSGAVYDFGDKFGATPHQAQTLLQAVAQAGFTPSMTFHPGTQCNDPGAWSSYISAAAQIARRAGVTLARLNVGGGFAANRGHGAPDHGAIFQAIADTTQAAFDTAPGLLCEPGRAMVADAVTLAVQIKARPEPDVLFLNDGLYGALAEFRDMTGNRRVTALGPDGALRTGPSQTFTVFGPTCDSLDRLPEPMHLPASVRDGDYLLIAGMGAYSSAVATRFNGYGNIRTVTVRRLS